MIVNLEFSLKKDDLHVLPFSVVVVVVVVVVVAVVVVFVVVVVVDKNK